MLFRLAAHEHPLLGVVNQNGAHDQGRVAHRRWLGALSAAGLTQVSEKLRSVQVRNDVLLPWLLLCRRAPVVGVDPVEPFLQHQVSLHDLGVVSEPRGNVAEVRDAVVDQVASGHARQHALRRDGADDVKDKVLRVGVQAVPDFRARVRIHGPPGLGRNPDDVSGLHVEHLVVQLHHASPLHANIQLLLALVAVGERVALARREVHYGQPNPVELQRPLQGDQTFGLGLDVEVRLRVWLLAAVRDENLVTSFEVRPRRRQARASEMSPVPSFACSCSGVARQPSSGSSSRLGVVAYGLKLHSLGACVCTLCVSVCLLCACV
mmetsp:Transcript_14390/g.27788  ORF Transcript_14390/g.27788 Transcript_14390/m.27788 type:complete len:321 (-) Transcript_14390:974-1936(-)